MLSSLYPGFLDFSVLICDVIVASLSPSVSVPKIRLACIARLNKSQLVEESDYDLILTLTLNLKQTP